MGGLPCHRPIDAFRTRQFLLSPGSGMVTPSPTLHSDGRAPACHWQAPQQRLLMHTASKSIVAKSRNEIKNSWIDYRKDFFIDPDAHLTRCMELIRSLAKDCKQFLYYKAVSESIPKDCLLYEMLTDSSPSVAADDAAEPTPEDQPPPPPPSGESPWRNNNGGYGSPYVS
uniref:Uncharacterized protein n=1 Tax=Romanomermis culicivorax TaxID=13658 RepID=A0A915KF30_ROMCU